jgi:hypothetical protein
MPAITVSAYPATWAWSRAGVRRARQSGRVFREPPTGSVRTKVIVKMRIIHGHRSTDAGWLVGGNGTIIKIDFSQAAPDREPAK